MAWIGVDLDGTLARHPDDNSWNPLVVGPPIPAMVARVKRWLAEGWEVRIFTARVTPSRPPDELRVVARVIQLWCEEHIGRSLAVTACKDYDMVELWDDRAVAVERDTGRALNPSRELGP